MEGVAYHFGLALNGGSKLVLSRAVIRHLANWCLSNVHGTLFLLMSSLHSEFVPIRQYIAIMRDSSSRLRVITYVISCLGILFVYSLANDFCSAGRSLGKDLSSYGKHPTSTRGKIGLYRVSYFSQLLRQTHDMLVMTYI
jgi:hypothetical protein